MGRDASSLHKRKRRPLPHFPRRGTLNARWVNAALPPWLTPPPLRQCKQERIWACAAEASQGSHQITNYRSSAFVQIIVLPRLRFDGSRNWETALVPSFKNPCFFVDCVQFAVISVLFLMVYAIPGNVQRVRTSTDYKLAVKRFDIALLIACCKNHFLVKTN